MNQIVYEEPSAILFSKLELGDTYSHKGNSYMRALLIDNHGYKFNAIDLSNGNYAFFLDEVLVKRINRLTIEKIS